jgi:hypothetical protein
MSSRRCRRTVDGVYDLAERATSAELLDLRVADLQQIVHPREELRSRGHDRARIRGRIEDVMGEGEEGLATSGTGKWFGTKTRQARGGCRGRARLYASLLHVSELFVSPPHSSHVPPSCLRSHTVIASRDNKMGIIKLY